MEPEGAEVKTKLFDSLPLKTPRSAPIDAVTFVGDSITSRAALDWQRTPAARMVKPGDIAKLPAAKGDIVTVVGVGGEPRTRKRGKR